MRRKSVDWFLCVTGFSAPLQFCLISLLCFKKPSNYVWKAQINTIMQLQKERRLSNDRQLSNKEYNKQMHSFSKTTTKRRTYFGLVEKEWKQRCYNQTQSFRNARHKNDTELYSCSWGFKKKTSEIPKLTWSKQIVPGHLNISERCLLDLPENCILPFFTIKRCY